MSREKEGDGDTASSLMLILLMYSPTNESSSGD